MSDVKVWSAVTITDKVMQDRPCPDYFVAEGDYDALRDEVARLRGAIVWALGYTDFRAREEGEGAYWWRPELRRRAALTPEQIEQAKAALTPQAGKGDSL